jgi:GNAT superfamily N-acetyltransferase
VGPDVTIRPATAADEAAVTDLHARCIGDAFAGRYFPPEEERAERQRSWAGPIGAPHPRHALLVAEQAHRVVGFVAVGPARGADLDSAMTGELRVILVDARERGLGVGSALIAGAERAMEIYPDVVDGLEDEGGVPSRLLKTDAGVGRQEGTPWEMFAGSMEVAPSRLRSRWMSWLVRARGG